MRYVADDKPSVTHQTHTRSQILVLPVAHAQYVCFETFICKNGFHVRYECDSIIY